MPALRAYASQSKLTSLWTSGIETAARGDDARGCVCLATVPTGADEAADRRVKFYELRDDLVRFPEWQQVR
jgi:hypothetical protein